MVVAAVERLDRRLMLSGNTLHGVAIEGARANAVGRTVAGADSPIRGKLQHHEAIVKTVAHPPSTEAALGDPLTLTQAGINAGFSLSTFADNFPTAADSPYGPFGVAFPSSGGVLAADQDGNVYRFPTDTDGQDASDTSSVKTVFYGAYNDDGLVRLGTTLYMAQKTAEDVVQLDDSGNEIQSIVGGLADATGIIANPADGHLLVSTGPNGTHDVYDVNPATKTQQVLISNIGGDGSDGMVIDSVDNILYVAISGYGVQGFNLTSKAKIWDSGPFGSTEGSPDGLALGEGVLQGLLFVNTNGGNIIEIPVDDPSSHIEIANMGSRGDLVAVDPNNGTLLVTQSTSIIRLSPPPGGGFLGGPIALRSPTITWPTPAPIVYGTALGAAQLDATASYTVGGVSVSLPGTFTYTPAAGRVLDAGPGQTLSVIFTPADATEYASVSATTTVNVLPSGPSYATRTELTARPRPGTLGRPITLTATVKKLTRTGGTPSGIRHVPGRHDRSWLRRSPPWRGQPQDLEPSPR